MKEFLTHQLIFLLPFIFGAVMMYVPMQIQHTDYNKLSTQLQELKQSQEYFFTELKMTYNLTCKK
jgi:hypothetical protein